MQLPPVTLGQASVELARPAFRFLIVNQVVRPLRDGSELVWGNTGLAFASVSGGCDRPMMTRTARMASEAVALASTSAGGSG